MPKKGNTIFIERLCHIKPGLCLEIHRWGSVPVPLSLGGYQQDWQLAVGIHGALGVVSSSKKAELKPGQSLILCPNSIAHLTPVSKGAAVMTVSLPNELRHYRTPEFGQTFRSILQCYGQLLKSIPSGIEYLVLDGFVEFAPPMVPPLALPDQKEWYLVALSSLMLKILEEIRQSLNPDKNSCGNHFEDFLPIVEAMIQEDPCHPPTLDELSKQTGLSPSTMSRLFCKKKGMNMRRYIQEIRIHTAAQYLSTGKYNVSESARKVGYESMAQFTRAFKRVMGTSPKKFSRQTPRARRDS